MAEYTKEQKQEYFKNLRDQWKQNKLDASLDSNAKLRYEAILQEAGGKISFEAYYWTLRQMEKLNLVGEPYIDCKTFDGWKLSGFKVRKGEKSKISGITWLSFKTSKGGENGKKAEDVVYPKLYHLFHTSQVEAIEK